MYSPTKQAANLRMQSPPMGSSGPEFSSNESSGRKEAVWDLDANPRPTIDFHASVLRCQNAEACRERDLLGQTTEWHRRAAVTYFLRQFLTAAAWARDALVGSVRSIRSLPEILPLCDQADLVSFDLFDTLLYRTVEPPDYLKRLAANHAAQLYSSRGYPVTADLFLYLRNESEARQRRLARTHGSDTECKLSEIIHEVLYRLFDREVAETETSTLVQYEIDIECRHLRVAEGVPELLQRLKSRGKRIVVTTDTYLEQPCLQKILGHLKIDQWIDAIYASSEHGVGKYSGRLFHRILDKEGIPPARIIHVGDTYESDIRGAIRAGVPAVYLFDVRRLRRRRRLSRETERSHTAAVKPVRQRRESAVPGISNSYENGQLQLYRIGREILGPAFTLFVFDVIQESHRVGAADVYYLAREGLLFRRLHEILTELGQQTKHLAPLRNHYLFVSRLATSLPAIRELSKRELHLSSYRDRNATLAECIRSFGLDPFEFSDLPVKLEERSEAAKASLFAHPEFLARVRVRANSARARLRAYLDQEEFFHPGEVKLLVDIGWNTTIQANLTQAFHDDRAFPLLVGCYFGRKYLHEDYLVSSRSLYMPGRFYDQKRRSKTEHAIGHCLEMFELAAAAPHGTTVGYEPIHGKIRPVLSDVGGSLSDEQRQIQRGILDYARFFAESRNTRTDDLGTLRSHAVGKLAQLILEPTLHQAKALRNFTHSVDWGSTQSRPLIAAEIGPLLFLAPGRLLAALRRSYWLEGCMRMSRIPGALAILSLTRALLRSRALFLRLRSATEMFFGQ